MADLATTQTMADGLSRQGLVYIAALSWTVSGGLFLWLMRVSRLRIDDRDRFQERLEALATRVAVHMDRATEVLTELRSRRRPTKEGPPTLPPEPTTQSKALP